MVYELRRWFDGEYCLFTDDRRLRDYARRDASLHMAGRYYRQLGDAQATGWDICGDRAVLEDLAHRFQQSGTITSRVA